MKSASILVVDDDSAVRESVSLLLQYDGHEVAPVESGTLALAKLAERQFDLVITDYAMPGMRGDELISRIRQQMPRQPILMISAYAHEARLSGTPVNGILEKPFSLAALRNAVGQALRPGTADAPQAGP
jgi:CheY-like chemotaxis protein